MSQKHHNIADFKVNLLSLPEEVLAVMFEELPDSASIFYLKLYRMAIHNSENPGSIQLSISDIVKMFGESKSKIKRLINLLKEKEYIDTVAGNGVNTPNTINVLFPKRVVNKLFYY